jgi:hypothetical protein
VARTGAPGETADELKLVIEALNGIEADAEVVRRTDTDLSLRFTAIDDDAALLLQQVSVEYYRSLG